MEELINWAVSASRAKPVLYLSCYRQCLAQRPAPHILGKNSFKKKKEYIPELSGLFKVTEQLAVRQEPRPPDAPSARLSVLHEPNSGVLKKGQ